MEKQRKRQRTVIAAEQTVFLLLCSSLHHYSQFLRLKFPILILVRIIKLLGRVILYEQINE